VIAASMTLDVSWFSSLCSMIISCRLTIAHCPGRLKVSPNPNLSGFGETVSHAFLCDLSVLCER